MDNDNDNDEVRRLRDKYKDYSICKCGTYNSHIKEIIKIMTEVDTDLADALYSNLRACKSFYGSKEVFKLAVDFISDFSPEGYEFKEVEFEYGFFPKKK
jgi:hypothetical protein